MQHVYIYKHLQSLQNKGNYMYVKYCNFDISDNTVHLIGYV